jgi:hypothetical protein
MARSRTRPSMVVFLPLAVLLLALATAPTPARSEVAYLEATASFSWELYRDPSPTPYCWRYWMDETQSGQALHFSEIYEELPCLSSWLVHCDGDSLRYQGSWPAIDPTHPYWNYNWVEVGIVARFDLTEHARILARREVSGSLSTDEHFVRITPVPGEDLVLLGPETGDLAEVELEPGVYDITLAVTAIEHNTHYAYTGDVQVWWQNLPTGLSKASSWGMIKALYHWTHLAP